MDPPYTLWNDKKATVKKLYRAANGQEEGEKLKKEQKDVNAELWFDVAFGNVDIKNPMSGFVNEHLLKYLNSWLSGLLCWLAGIVLGVQEAKSKDNNNNIKEDNKNNDNKPKLNEILFPLTSFRCR